MGNDLKVDVSTHGGFAAAVAKLNQIQHALAAGEKEIQGINSRLAGVTTGAVATDPLTREAQKLLEGGEAMSADVGRVCESLRSELGTAMHKCQVLRRALEIQQHAVDKYRAEASATICERALPIHRENAQAVLRGLIALGEANLREEALRDKLSAGGVTFSASIFPMQFFRAGNPLDPNGHICTWVKEAYEHGLIAASDVPPHWQRAWKEQAGFELRLIDNWKKETEAPPQRKPVAARRQASRATGERLAERNQHD